MATTAHELIADCARREARETLLNARARLERELLEMDRYIEYFDQAQNDRDRAKAINWAINELVSGILPNLRIDMLASAQANLEKLED